MKVLRSWGAQISLAGLLTLFTGNIAWAEPSRLPLSVRPTEQSVYLKTDPTADRYTGHTVIELQVENEVGEIKLHALDLKITSARLANAESTRTLQPLAEEGPVAVLKSETGIPLGTYSLHLEFEAPFNTRSVGLYKYTDQGRKYLSTQFEMTDARRCFPCFDEPSFKIPYQMTIEAPKGERVYNNSPEIEQTEKGEWVVHRFSKTPPIPSYLVALAVGPYEDTSVEGMKVPGRIVTPEGKLALTDFAKTNTPKYIKALEEYFDIPYAYAKLDQVAVSEFPFGAMENAGLVTYRTDILLVNPQTAGFDLKSRSAAVMAHELAHQWFGNLVTMKWWDDLWLNEAFATWMAFKITEKLHPEYEFHLYVPQNKVMGTDANLSSKPIRKPIKTETDIMDGLGLAYNKGCAALNMVERWIGEETFRAGIRAYLNEHRFGNAEAADLWETLGRVSDKDVASVLKSFTEQPGYPLVTLSVQGKSLQLTQRRFTPAGTTSPPMTWDFPLFLRYGRGDRVASRTIEMKGPRQSVELDFEPEWLLPDEGGVGYFRWAIPDQALASILRQRDLLTDREKLTLLANIDGLVDGGVISAGRQLELTTPFLTDPHPAVVGAALASIENLSRLYVNDENRANWRRFLAKALAPLMARYGEQPRPQELPRVAELRPILLELQWRDAGDPKLAAYARAEADRYLEGEPVEPTLAELYLLIAARQAEPEWVDRVKDALLRAKDPQRRTALLNTLGEFGRADSQERALNLMLSPETTASDLRYLLALNGREESRRKRLQAWLELNYTALSNKLPSAFRAVIIDSLSGARDLEQLRAILAFYRDQPDPEGVNQRALAKLEDEIRARVSTIERGQPSFDQAISR